jgi:hypothetical protein
MHLNGRTLLQSSSRFALAVLFATLTPIWSALGVGPAGTAPANLVYGTWSVQGRAIHGTRSCGDWLVRGVLSLARSSVPIRNLVLQADGSFSGTTQPGVVGSRHVRAYRVSGKFSGDGVSLTLDGAAWRLNSGDECQSACAAMENAPS